jgi:cytochrome c
VEQGTLTLSKLNEGESFEGRGDLRTTAPFENFELRLQWIAASGSNSGIFFFGRESAADRLWQVAPEMQVLDDVVSEDNLAPSHRAGGLYDLYAPKCNALRPAGEFNDVRLVVRNGHVEHWLNGYRIVEYDLDSPDFRSRVALSKFRDMPQFAKLHRGFVALQDHGDVIRFRNVRIHAF